MIDKVAEILMAVLAALGFVRKVESDVEASHPKLAPPPPPADKAALDRQLDAIRKAKGL